MTRTVGRILCAVLALSLLFSACGGQAQEGSFSSQSDGSNTPSSTSSSDIQETGSSGSTESSSSQSSSGEVTDDFNPQKKKIGYELFLNRPEELLYLEDISSAYRQTLGKVDILHLWIDYDQKKDLFSMSVQSITPSRWRGFLFQPDGTVTESNIYPSGSCPKPMPSWVNTIQWDYDLETVVQYKDGNIVPLELPEFELSSPNYLLSISSDEKWISYISNDKLYLYDMVKEQLAWNMTPEEIGFEQGSSLASIAIEENQRLQVNCWDSEQNNMSTLYLNLLGQKIPSPDTTSAFSNMEGRGQVTSEKVDEVHYLWLPRNASNEGARESVWLVEQKENRMEPIKELNIIAQKYNLSEDGKWILFIDQNEETSEINLTLCDTATFTPRWNTTLQLANSNSIFLFTIRHIENDSLRILFTIQETLVDKSIQFFTLTPPAEALS